MKNKITKYTVGGLYSGIGGIEKGFQNAGFKIQWSNEYDRAACTTLKANFKDHVLYEEDIYSVDINKLEHVDIIVAGFPCQAFSIAGYQKGFEDTRGNHFFKIMELAKKIKPRIIFLENVKNLMRHDKGNTWQTIMNSLERNNYAFKNDVLNSMKYGNVPQTRERFYAVCFNRSYNNWKTLYENFEFPQPIDLKMQIKDILTKEIVDEKYYYREDKYNYRKLVESMKKEDTIYQWRRVYVRENKSNVCPTLTANMGTGGHNVPLIRTNKGIRKLTPEECFKFQGYYDIKLPKNGISNSELYKQAGNSVVVPVITRIASHIKKALVACDK